MNTVHTIRTIPGDPASIHQTATPLVPADLPPDAPVLDDIEQGFHRPLERKTGREDGRIANDGYVDTERKEREKPRRYGKGLTEGDQGMSIVLLHLVFELLMRGMCRYGRLARQQIGHCHASVCLMSHPRPQH